MRSHVMAAALQNQVKASTITARRNRKQTVKPVIASRRFDSIGEHDFPLI
jgi:hypothetical protein